MLIAWSSAAVAPVMIATASDIEWVWGVTTATRLPSRMMLDAVGELEDVRHVVADQDHRQAALAHAADQLEHLAASP